MDPNSRLDVRTRREEICKGLDDAIWVEILSRLPSTYDVFQCKCVSKSWNSLTSEKYFIRRFIEQNRKRNGSDFNVENLLCFNYASTNNKEGTGILAYPNNNTILSLPNLEVQSSYNDLLLCCETRSVTYHIVNPFTKEHVELPHYNPEDPYSSSVGFVCEPFYRHGGTHFDPIPNYRYRIIRIIDSRSFRDFQIEIYFSETKQRSLVTGLDRIRYGCQSNVVAHRGKFYWYNFRMGVVSYNPFVASDEPDFKSLRLIETQTSFNSYYFQLAKSQGSVLLMQMTRQGKESYVSISKLEEEDEGGHGDRETFRFERTIAINNLVSDTSPNFIRRVLDNGNTLLALGIHPNNLLSSWATKRLGTWHPTTWSPRNGKRLGRFSTLMMIFFFCFTSLAFRLVFLGGLRQFIDMDGVSSHYDTLYFY